MNSNFQDRLPDSTSEVLLENIIQTLSNCINTEFNKNSGSSEEELFCAPSLNKCDIVQKLQLARDLSDLLANVKSKRESILTNESIYSLRNYRRSCILQNTDELLEKIFDPTCEALSLTPSQAEEILLYIQNNSLKSESAKMRKPLSGYQKDLILVSQKIEELKKNFRVIQDRKDFLELNNKELRETLKILKNQDNLLEKKLKDSIEEKYFAKENITEIKGKLEKSKELLSSIITLKEDNYISSPSETISEIVNELPRFSADVRNPYNLIKENEN